MVTHVYLKGAGPHECFVSLATWEWLNITMAPDMVYEVSLSTKAFVTHHIVARVWFLTGMGPYMSLEVALFREPLAAAFI
jgi:hypothetical protein